MSKVVVIGAGASGIIAALKASEKNEVILLDGNDKCGKKILLTGNGKCNYWNQSIDLQNYQTDDPEKLKKILEKQKEVFSFLEKLGIYPRIKDGYYYPYSNQSSSIQTILNKALEKAKIVVKYHFKVSNILKKENQFVIESDEEEIVADKVIIATGSKAFSKTGSDGSGYQLVQKLGHHINHVLPSLVPLVGKEVPKWEGNRIEANVQLYVNDQKIKEEHGELQLTDYGVSGICIFNLSGVVSKNLYLKNKVLLKINFFKEVDNLFSFLEERSKMLKNATIEEILESLISYKLLLILLQKVKINKDKNWFELSKVEKQNLVSVIQSYPLQIIDTLSFDRAQVCTGGVPLKEVGANLESNLVSNLYIVGEMLDVDGICGGFNLASSFITGYIAGSDIHD